MTERTLCIEARSKLYALIDKTSTSHQPIVITGKRGNAELLAEEDWNAINKRFICYQSLVCANLFEKAGLTRTLDDWQVKQYSRLWAPEEFGASQ